MGLEPTQPKPLPPQDSVYTNFTTSALKPQNYSGIWLPLLPLDAAGLAATGALDTEADAVALAVGFTFAITPKSPTLP